MGNARADIAGADAWQAASAAAAGEGPRFIAGNVTVRPGESDLSGFIGLSPGAASGFYYR